MREPISSENCDLMGGQRGLSQVPDQGMHLKIWAEPFVDLAAPLSERRAALGGGIFQQILQISEVLQ